MPFGVAFVPLSSSRFGCWTYRQPLRCPRCLPHRRRVAVRAKDVPNAEPSREPFASNTWQEVFAPRPFSELRVGGIAVPRHLWNPKLRRKGIFRSVEYRILRLQFDGRDISSTSDLCRSERDRQGDVVATIRPIRRLLPKFERLCSWPVAITVSDASLWSYKRDLAQCLAVALFTAFSTILFGVFVPNFYSLYFIPSQSMYPTLKIGDTVLVQKVHSSSSRDIARGDVVFFRPTSRLLELVREDEQRNLRAASSHGPGRSMPHVRSKDLFVKRVAAVPGDLLSIENNHIIVNGAVVSEAASGSNDCDPQRVPPGALYLLGDDPSHSLDSRYWGLLPSDYVVGSPLCRIWPLNRISVFHRGMPWKSDIRFNGFHGP